MKKGRAAAAGKWEFGFALQQGAMSACAPSDSRLSRRAVIQMYGFRGLCTAKVYAT